MSDLARKTIDGATLNVSVILFKTVLQFAVVLPILARVIAPEQFGLVGMAMAFVTFFTMFNDLGISAALVRADKPSPAFWSTAFWTNLGLGIALTTLTYFAAPYIADFFREPIVEPLVQVLSLILIMHCMFLVPMAWLQRNFRFRTIAAIDLTATLISAAAAVIAALQGLGVWALVIQQLLLFTIKMIGGMIHQKAPLGLVFKWSEIVEVLPFSLRLTGAAFVAFVNRNTDNILIGRFLGAESLGFYGRAYQIMMVPVNSLSLGAGFALYPAMASIKHESERLGRLYLKSMSLLATATLPMMVGLALVAEPFVALVFGPNWAAIVPVLFYLSFVGIIQSLIGTSNVLWKALGLSEVLLRWGIYRMFGFVSAFVVGIYLGSIEALAAAFLIANLLMYLPFQLMTLRKVGISFSAFLGAIGPALVSTFVMAGAIIAMRLYLPQLPSWESYLQLAVLVPTGMAAFFLVMVTVFHRFVRDLVREARALLAKEDPVPTPPGAHAE